MTLHEQLLCVKLNLQNYCNMRGSIGFANFNITTIHTCIKHVIGKLLIVDPLASKGSSLYIIEKIQDSCREPD